MRMNSAIKTSAAMAALLASVLTASGATIAYAWHTRSSVNRAVSEGKANLLAVADLDAQLLKQRGYVAAHLMDSGDREWLGQQDRLAPLFRSTLERMKREAADPEFREMLSRLGESFERYDAAQSEVVTLRGQGRTEEAKDAFVGRMTDCYREVTTVCGELVEVSRREIAAVLDTSSDGLRRLSILVTASAALTALLGAGLLWFLYRDVFRPLRHIAREVETLSGAPDVPDLPERSGDVTALGTYLRMLVSEVRTSREDLQRTRRQAQHSGRLAAVGNAVARLAHEIKNALVPIGGFARMIERAPDDPGRVRENAQTIYQSAQRLENTIREVLEFSRPGRDNLCAQEVNKAVREALAGLAAQVPRGIAVESALDPETPAVPLPPGALERLVVNLVGNALEALGARGRVLVSTRRQGSGAAIIVADDGPGIPEDVRRHLFEPFFTTKRKGTGLGLAICRQIVVDLGGSIEFHSAPGQGATFTVLLPAGAAGAETGPA